MQALTNKASSLVYPHREKDRDLTFLVFLHSFFADLYFYQVYKYFSLSSNGLNQNLELFTPGAKMYCGQ